jgi:hypothetical protein
MSAKIQEAMQHYADRNQATIDKKFNGDVEAFKAKLLELFMRDCGKLWEKSEIKRIYMNDYNMFYDYETKALEAIDSTEPMLFDVYEARMVKLIDSD